MIPLTTSNDKCQDPYENGTPGLMLRPYFIIWYVFERECEPLYDSARA